VAAWPASALALALALAHGADLFVPVATLTAGKGPSTPAIPRSSDPTETFGTAVAVSANGHVLVVGAPRVTRIYVFVRPANGRWKDAHQTIALLGFTNNDYLGTSVAVSADGSTIVAGAPYENGGAGAVYIYVEPKGGWKHATVLPTNMLHAVDSTGNDALGASVAVSAHGSTIVAGAPGWRSEQGAIYLFRAAHNGWRHTSPLGSVWANVGEPGGNSAYGGVFGQTVAMSANADTIVVGAPNESGWEGGVYVFKRAQGRYRGYRELHDLASGTADNYFICSTSSGYGIGNPELGTTVAVSADGHTIASGEPCAGTGGQTVVYTEPRGGWLNASSNITAGLTPLAPNAAYTQRFGYWVALSGDGKTAIATDPAFYNGYGAFVAWFRKPQRGWSHVNPPRAANFGDVSGETAIAGGNQDITAGDPIAIGSIGGTIFAGGVGVHYEGAVYVFNESTAGGTPTELSCKPSKVAVGSKSTCTVTVSDPLAHGIVPTGSVAFSSNGGASGHLNHRSCKLRAEHGKVAAARCSVTFTPTRPLAYTISAHYGGNVHHLPGNDAAVIRTSRLATSTTVSCAPSSVKVGVKSSCTATATDVGLPAVTITFKVSGGTASGELCRPGTSAEVCTVGFSAASAGSYSVAAAYPGDAGHGPSGGHTTVTVTAQ
jgi:hypothetical protein